MKKFRLKHLKVFGLLFSMAVMCIAVFIPTETVQAYKSAVETAYSKADFTVTDVSRTTEDIYSVTVTCKKANIFKPAMDKFDKAISKMTAVEAGSMDYNDRVILMSKQIKQVCESDIKYDKEENNESIDIEERYCVK